MSMSEVDVKAEGELEEGETVDLSSEEVIDQHSEQQRQQQQTQVIQIEGTDETTPIWWLLACCR